MGSGGQYGVPELDVSDFCLVQPDSVRGFKYGLASYTLNSPVITEVLLTVSQFVDNLALPCAYCLKINFGGTETNTERLRMGGVMNQL